MPRKKVAVEGKGAVPKHIQEAYAAEDARKQQQHQEAAKEPEAPQRDWSILKRSFLDLCEWQCASFLAVPALLRLAGHLPTPGPCTHTVAPQQLGKPPLNNVLSYYLVQLHRCGSWGL